MNCFSAPSGPTGLRERSKLKVLIADDYPDAALTLAEFVGLCGHSVHVAYDGPSALEIAVAQRPDVILMELTLPKTSGVEVCRRLKATPWGQDTQVLAVTGWGAPSRIAQSREAGFDGHMLKPIDCGELERLLNRLATEKRKPGATTLAPRRFASGTTRLAIPLTLLL